MDISSFVLGMCSVVVVGFLAVMVNAMVKVKREIKMLEENVSINTRSIEETVNILRSEISDHLYEINSMIDSRLDKLTSRLRRLETHKVFQRDHDGDGTKSIPLGPLHPNPLHPNGPEPIPLGPLHPNGPSDFPAYPGHDYGAIPCNDYGIVTKDNTSNQ